MFANYINHHDMNALLAKPQKLLAKIPRIWKSANSNIAEVWSEAHTPCDWFELPVIVDYVSQALPENQPLPLYLRKKYGEKLRKAILVGCNDGRKDQKWLKGLSLEHLHGIDIASAAVSKAKKRAENAGYTHLCQHSVMSVDDESIPWVEYDLIIFEQSLHHLDPKVILPQLRNQLKPNTVIVADEFVGPTRFQWTPNQVKLVNLCLDQIPLNDKLYFNRKQSKEHVFTPSRLRMMINDASEAVCSEDIIPSWKKYFPHHEIYPYGGSLLHLLFCEMTHHFQEPTPSQQDMLRHFCELEQNLRAVKILNSDFAYLLAEVSA